MSVKHLVLQSLEQNREVDISGEQLAGKLNVSRAAVWKAINQLKKDGYQISAATNKGYRLSARTDLLSAEGIVPYLSERSRGIRIDTHKTLPSTNQAAKRLAVDGAAHGTVVLSEEQTMGRGRMGRSFFSPAQSGIYMSIILCPQISTSDSVRITTAAAVAVCRAIEAITGIRAQIKWVNDIYYNDRKLCGILTEAVTSFESGLVESIILGVGLNFSTAPEVFPPELREIAGSLFATQSQTIVRNRLVGEIINQLLTVCEEINAPTFLEEYRARSLVLGKKILVCDSSGKREATALDISENGGLVIQNSHGELETLHSGEITIRRI